VVSNRRWVLLAVALFLGSLLFRAQVIDTVRVTSDSMAPTICAGDRLLVEKLADDEAVLTDDLVVFRSPADGERTVKRVVALPGQRVEIRDGMLFVNRRSRQEGYVDRRTVDGVFFGPVVVTEGTVFVLGDRREFSIDSRDYGGVPRADVEGVVLATVWSSC
jgi:signal peptidase I